MLLKLPRVSRRQNTYRAARIAATVAVAASSAGLLASAAPAVADTPALPSLLVQGSAGPAVSRVQHVLHLHVTGHFGGHTRRAVLHYQRRHRLAVDGIVGPQTWGSLFGIPPEPIAPRPTTPQPTSESSSSTTPPPTTSSETTPSSTASGSGTSSSPGSGGYSVPSGIVQCESGGNYSAVNPSSGAGGAYQILPSTWQAYGGQGLPQDAPASEQDRIAGKIYAQQGASAWTC